MLVFCWGFFQMANPLQQRRCKACQFILKIVHRFCPNCGEPFSEFETLDSLDENGLICHYFSCGFTYSAIVKILEKRHGITMSQSTLKLRLKENNLRRRSVPYDAGEVHRRIVELLNGPGCMGGYRSIWHTLRLEGIQVPRHVVQVKLKELDPEGCELRKRKCLRRRQYHSPGPNHTWHVDGYDKLKPYGFPIHGAIDGWSRKIMWLKVARSNNLPEVPATFYLECVAEHGGCPVKVRSDCGTENGIIAAMQCEFRNDGEAHSFGQSTANQRIEGWWSFFRRNRSTWWINLFKDMIETEVLTLGNEIDMECLWFCFSKLIQKDLNTTKEHWNTHYIRKSRHDTVSGRPDELFYIPESYGGMDGLLNPIPPEQLEFVSDNLLQYEAEENMHQEYLEYLCHGLGFQEARTWNEGLVLYRRLVHIAKEGDN